MKQIISKIKDVVENLRTILEANPGVRSIYIGNFTALVKLKFGRRMYVDSRDVGVGSHIMITGVWEKHYTDLLKRIVKEGETFVDIGANFGYYSVLGGHLVGKQGQVYSFEPNPRPFELMKLSMKANGYLKPNNSNIFQMGVSNEKGEFSFNFKEGDFGGGSMFIPQGRLENENFSEITIKVDSLDNMLSHVEKLDFVKIDAEGAEVNIIKGMNKLIARSDNLKVLMEFYPKFIERHSSIDDFTAELSAHGFYFYRVNQDKLIEVKANDLSSLSNCYLLLSKAKI